MRSMRSNQIAGCIASRSIPSDLRAQRCVDFRSGHSSRSGCSFVRSRRSIATFWHQDRDGDRRQIDRSGVDAHARRRGQRDLQPIRMRYRYALLVRREVANDHGVSARDTQPPRLFVELDGVQIELAVLEIARTAAKMDQSPIPSVKFAMLSCLALVPIELGSLESLRCLRIRNLRCIGHEM